MRVFSAHILILAVIVTLLSITQTAKLNDVENQKRLKECGRLKHSKVLGGQTGSAPFLIKLEYPPAHLQSGALISKRHVITHPESVLVGNFNETKIGANINLSSPDLDACKMEIPKDWMNNINVSTCGADPDCKTSNQSQIPIRGLYIGSCNKEYAELGIIVLEFAADFNDKTAVPICITERRFDFGNQLSLVGLGASAINETMGKVRLRTTEGKHCPANDNLRVCTSQISCRGDSGAPFVVSRGNTLIVVAIAAYDGCDEGKVLPNFLLYELSGAICEFSGVCSKNYGSRSTTTTESTTTFVTTSSKTGVTTKKSSPTTFSKPTTMSMTHSTSSASTKPPTAPVTEQKASTTPAVVIDIEDEPGLEDEGEEETEYVYIDEPDVSSRDTSVLLVLIFLSSILLFS